MGASIGQLIETTRVAPPERRRPTLRIGQMLGLSEGSAPWKESLFPFNRRRGLTRDIEHDTIYPFDLVNYAIARAA